MRPHAPQLLVLSLGTAEDIKKCCGKFGDPRVADQRFFLAYLCVEDGTAVGFLHGFTCVSDEIDPQLVPGRE